jgi:hypothetical protein
VERNVRFYVLRCEKRLVDGTLERTNPVEVLARTNRLSFDAPDTGRYAVDPGGDAIAMMLDQTTRDSAQGKFFRVRRRGLPSVERAGRVHPLAIQPDEGLFEPCHFVLFGGSVLGYEGNYFGPRAGNLPRYIMEKMPDIVDRSYLEPIFRQDWERRLRQIGEVKLFQIAVARDMERQLHLLNESVAGMLRAGKEASEAEEIEVILRGHRYSRGRFRINWLNNIRRFLRDEHAKAGTSKFVIVADNRETGETETFDLLRDALVFAKQIRVAEGRTRTVDSDSAYAAIREAYREAEPELRRFMVGE